VQEVLDALYQKERTTKGEEESRDLRSEISFHLGLSRKKHKEGSWEPDG